MKRSWLVVAVIGVGLIGVVNILVLLGFFPHRKPADNSVSAVAPAAPTAAVPSVAPQAVSSAPQGSSNALPAPATGAANSVAASAHRHPAPPPVQAGMHLERQVLTASGNLRVRYLRDREHGLHQISIQDVHNPANEIVLAQYKRSAWVIVSPNDDWIVLERRDKDERGVQLFQRVNSAPLKYEVPADLQANGSGLRDVIWQSYLQATHEDPSMDAQRVTIDATSWESDSQKVTLSVTPVPTKGDSALPMAWTCLYNVNTKRVEPTADEVAEGPQDQPGGGAPNEMPTDNSNAPAAENAAANEDTQATATGGETPELEGEKFPATREEEITVQDANELELADVKYAIFEMYARHGAEMHDAQMKKTFSQFSWYQPQEGLTFDQAEKEFSDIEKHNLGVLRRVRDAKLAVHRRPEQRAIRGQPVEQESDSERVIRGVLQGVSDALGNH
jgi:hypothetical protein